MKCFCAFKFIIAIVALAIFTACSDYLDCNNSETRNGRIGLPGNVNIINTENNNSNSRAINGNLIPDIHTRTSIGGMNPIYFRYTTTPGIVTSNKAKKTSASTRGIAITTNSFYDAYSLYSYVYPGKTTWAAKISSSNLTFSESYFDQQVTQGKGWELDLFWPGSSQKCAFFAYAPYHAKGLSNFTTNSWPSFHYSVPINVTEQSDLLVTKNEIPANANAYGNIDISGGFNKPDSITFDHACTAIRFAIGDQMAPGIIKSIKINNVYSTGDYNYQTESWSNVDSLKSFTLTQDFEIQPGEHNKMLNNDDNVFMMIPQTVPDIATIEVTINDGSQRTIKAYLTNDVWKKGYTVTYYLSTAKVGSSYVLSIAPASGNIGCTGGTKAVTIRSYKQSYYGSQIAVPWTAFFTYDDAGEVGTTIYNSSTDIVPGFVASGNGSTIGESTSFEVGAQVARSKSWRSSHTKILREAADASCNLAANNQTANCYVIQAPGTYTFPLVYGNALNADGSSNNNSFGTASFVDHNGVQINSPYIYATNGGANVPYDACIVWQDAPHLITPSSVQLTSDKHSIQFTIERKNICQGNCVIAVRDKNQNIMWSWHIWVTDHSMTNTIMAKNNENAGGAVTSYFMEVPLGWCNSEARVYDQRTFHITVQQTETGGQTATANVLQLSSDSTYTYGVNAPYYQWGRKDPLLPSNGMGNIDKPCYDNQYTPRIAFSTSNMKDLIQHPNMFNTSTLNVYLDLWNKGNSVTTLNNNVVNKTIYSSSPVNYSEPKAAAFTGFTSSNVSGSFNAGYNFYCNPNQTGSTIFFSALGYLVYNSNAIIRVNTQGNYWTANPYSASSGRDFQFNSGSISEQITDIYSYGFPIRAVIN